MKRVHKVDMILSTLSPVTNYKTKCGRTYWNHASTKRVEITYKWANVTCVHCLIEKYRWGKK